MELIADIAAEPPIDVRMSRQEIMDLRKAVLIAYETASSPDDKRYADLSRELIKIANKLGLHIG